MAEEIWFNGPVKDAVSLVTQRNCVFLVYIHDDSEKSQVLKDTLTNEEIVKSIQAHAIALRMEKDSENATLFKQFYPVQAVPILYFIKHGVIKDFGTETIAAQEIVDKIKTLSVEQQASASSTSQSLTEGNAQDDKTKDIEAAKKAEMQNRLKEARKQREEREKKEAKEREVQRRNEAKAMQEARQIQKDKENQVFMDKLRKEKKEAEEHKRKVREQIARDRAEKMAQRKTDKERQVCSQQTSESSLGQNRQSHAFSNLNIRMIDGTTIRRQFEASDTLATVKDWINQSRTDGKRDYKLSAQFPTRLFTEADSSNTLRDLNLCPSATVIMKPAYGPTLSLSSQTDSHGGILGLGRSGFDYLYGFVISLINFLAGMLEALFPRHGNRPPSGGPEQPLVRNLRGGHRLGGSSSDAGKSSSIAEKGQKRYSFATRVNTIHDEGNSDDENEKRPTYNGNSVNHE